MKRNSANSASKNSSDSAEGSSYSSRTSRADVDAGAYIRDLDEDDDEERGRGRAKRKLSFGPKPRATSTKKLKLKPVAAAVEGTTSASALKIDKIVLALYDDAASGGEAETLHQRLQLLLKQKQVVRGTSKGEGFSNVYLQRLPSKAVIKYAIKPVHQNVRQVLQITLNPNAMEPEDVQDSRDMLHRVLGLRSDRLIAELKCTRLDTCIDVQDLFVNDLIVVFAGARTQSTFFVASDTGGRVQTIYCGSVQSAERACVYDQNDADAFKALVGEKPSGPELRRKKVKDDAELGITGNAKAGRTRFEVRNVLDTPVTLRDLRKMKSAFHKFEVFNVSGPKTKRWPLGFIGYLDLVRVRGLAGARLYVAKNGSREAQAEVQKYEQRLAKLAVRRWLPDDYVLNLRDVLREHGLWSVLCPAKT